MLIKRLDEKMFPRLRAKVFFQKNDVNHKQSIKSNNDMSSVQYLVYSRSIDFFHQIRRRREIFTKIVTSPTV